MWHKNPKIKASLTALWLNSNNLIGLFVWHSTIICCLICFYSCHNYNLKRLAILSFQCYRLLLVYNATFTILILFLFGFPKPHVHAGSFFFAKVIGFISAAAVYYYTAEKTYYYFRNAGIAMRKVMVCAFLIDIVLALFFMLLTILSSYVAGAIKG